MSSIFNATTLAAVISGIIGLVIVLIQNVIPNIKYRFEVRNNFNDLLNDKLEKVYSPLVIMLLKINQDSKLISEDVEKIVLKYAHLFSKNLLVDMLEIYKMEQLLGSETQSDLYIQEYKNIKIKVLEKVNSEFKELQDTFNKDFIDKKEKLFIPWYKKIVSATIFICVLITIIFYIILIVIYFLQSLKSTPAISTDPLLNALIAIIVIIVATTSIFLIGFMAQSFLDRISEIKRKQKKYYYSNEYVIDTGYYKCRVCNINRIHLVKGSKVPKCKQHNFRQRLKSIMLIYNWAFEENHQEH